MKLWLHPRGAACGRLLYPCHRAVASFRIGPRQKSHPSCHLFSFPFVLHPTLEAYSSSRVWAVWPGTMLEAEHHRVFSTRGIRPTRASLRPPWIPPLFHQMCQAVRNRNDKPATLVVPRPARDQGSEPLTFGRSQGLCTQRNGRQRPSSVVAARGRKDVMPLRHPTPGYGLASPAWQQEGRIVHGSRPVVMPAERPETWRDRGRAQGEFAVKKKRGVVLLHAAMAHNYIRPCLKQEDLQPSDRSR